MLLSPKAHTNTPPSCAVHTPCASTSGPKNDSSSYTTSSTMILQPYNPNNHVCAHNKQHSKYVNNSGQVYICCCRYRIRSSLSAGHYPRAAGCCVRVLHFTHIVTAELCNCFSKRAKSVESGPKIQLRLCSCGSKAECTFCCHGVSVLAQSVLAHFHSRWIPLYKIDTNKTHVYLCCLVFITRCTHLVQQSRSALPLHVPRLCRTQCDCIPQQLLHLAQRRKGAQERCHWSPNCQRVCLQVEEGFWQ